MPFQAVLGGLQVAAPFLGKLFGGGPSREDLPQELRDVSAFLRGALQQSQDLRGDFIQDSRELKGIDVANARSVGGFNPTSLGGQFDFLQPTVDQFSEADFAANAIRSSLERELPLMQLVNSLALQAPATELGITQQLSNAATAAGGGLGSALGSSIAALGNQSLTGTGLGGLLGGLGGGGEQVLNAPPAQQIGGIGQLPPAAGSDIVSQAMSSLLQSQELSPLIQSILAGQTAGVR